jgi:hypothetical protein
MITARTATVDFCRRMPEGNWRCSFAGMANRALGFDLRNPHPNWRIEMMTDQTMADEARLDRILSDLRALGASFLGRSTAGALRACETVVRAAKSLEELRPVIKGAVVEDEPCVIQ